MTGSVWEGLETRWFGFRAEVAFQLATLLIVAMAIVIAVVVDPTPLGTAAFAVAIGLFAATTVLAVILGRFDTPWLLLVPILDMIALIIMRQVPEDHVHAIGYLAILPALWLGWSGRPLFAGVAVLLTLGLIELPSTSETGQLDLEHALRNFLTPAVVAAVAASTCIASRLSSSSIRSLMAQEKVTAGALLREQQTSKMLDAIVDAVDTAVVAFDADGNQILVNRQALQHPSIVDDSATGLDLEARGHLFGPDRVTPVPAEDGVIGRALRGDEFVGRIVWVGVPGMRPYAVSASARSLRDEDDQFVGTVVAMNDVTAYLETIAVKDDFVASMSHEFRTPLASIVGYLELIEDGGAELPDEICRHLSVIDRNTQRLQRLVTDLLATASEKERAIPLERRSTDISDLCGGVVDGFQKTARDTQVRLRLHAPDAAVALVDGPRMRQAIGNLVSNAVKFSPSGDVDVSVETVKRFVVVTIADSGVGVPPDELAAITSRFYRATTVRDRFPGVGLGLSVSKTIVEAHRGSIDIASEDQRGTTVTVTLPAR